MLTFEYSAANSDAPVAFASFEAMHTVMELLVAQAGERQARDAVREVSDYVADLDAVFNRFDPESEVAALNSVRRKATGEHLYEALDMCRVFSGATLGYFDITAGSGGYTLDAGKREAALGDGAVLDFGGFAKGYALEGVKKILDGAGIKRALVNFGDSSVLAIGAHPYGDYWSVGVEGVPGNGFNLCDSALSVSGRNRSGLYHIVDPHTAEVVRRGGMVAVTGRSALVCEVLSTGLFAAPQEKRAQILASFPGYEAVYF